jgi:hypothetical protein
MKKFIPYIIIIITSLAYLLIVSQYNLGITPDSVKYIEIANNISNGKGIILDNEIATHFPPGYPILLGITSKITGISVLQIGKFINLSLFIILGIVFKLIVDKIGFNNTIKNSLLATLLVSLPISVALNFWSELLFIVFIASSFLFYLKWKDRYHTSLLIISGCFSLLALMTRYAAIGFIGGFLLSIMLSKSENFLKKILNLFYLSFPVLLGSCCWLYYTHQYAESTTNRDFVIHFVAIDKMLNSFKTIFNLIINSPIATIAISSFFMATIYFIYKNYNSLATYFKSGKLSTRDLFILVITYYVFILLSMSFFDAHIPMDNRILSPLFIFILLIIGYMIQHMSSFPFKRISSIVLVLIFFLSIGSSLHKWRDHYNNGFGYSSKEFSQYIDTIIENIVPYKGEIYTNGINLIKMVSNKQLNLKSIPVLLNPGTNKDNANFSNELQKMQASIVNNKALIIYFDKIDKWYLMSREELLNQIKHQKITTFKDGFIIN